MNSCVKKSRRSASAASKKEKRSLHRTFCDLQKSLLITLSFALAVLLAASLVAYFYRDPHLLITPLALICCAATAFFGGFVTCRIRKDGALLCGLLMGSVLTALSLPLSVFFKPYASSYSHLVCALLRLGFMLLSILGAYAGVPRKQNKRRRHKRKMK